jgi:hypothetical protein
MRLLNTHWVVAFFLTTSSFAFAEDWTPPKKPDLQAILREAKADAQAKRYKVALAKHVWFHDNALSIDKAMTGVRLSFALSDWKQLGNEYPPAMAKLRSIRDALQDKANKGNDLGNGMHDLVAINRTLEEDSRTTEAFKSLDVLNPKAAKKAFPFVKPALVKDKEYKLYITYVDPQGEFQQMKHLYELNQKMAKEPKIGTQFADFGNKTFRNGCVTLVAILAINDRKTEADEIATLAKKELDDAEFQKELVAALSGIVPKPWP